MYRVLLAVFGLPVGLVIGALTGVLLGSTLDNPNAGHMTRGAGALAGMFLVAPLGAVVGIVCGFWIGRWMDRRGEQRALRSAGAAHIAEGLQNHRRIQRRAQTRIVMCAACGRRWASPSSPGRGPEAPWFLAAAYWAPLSGGQAICS